MPSPDQSAVANRLLKSLSPDDFARLAPDLEPVSLPRGTTIVEEGDAFTHVHFLENGLGSVVARTPEGDEAEVGMFGVEGLAGLPVLLGVRRSEHWLTIQVGGHGLRIAADRLVAAFAASPSLRERLLAYVQYFMLQVAQTAVSNGRHSVEERLGRWLLMAHDRLGDDEIPLTHEYLALMLAVRRPSVTTALHVLEGAGFVRGLRGSIRMRDRAGLEAFASAAYGVPEAAYARLIGPLR